jgi:hypothetical protein
MRSILLAFFLAFLGTSQATILIFKGTFTEKSFPSNGLPSGGAYLVYDTNSKNYTLVRFYRKDGQKGRSVEYGTFFAGTVTLSQGRTATVLGDDDEFNEIATASRSLLRLKGNNSTIVYNAQNQTLIFPAVFTGTRAGVDFFNGAASTQDRRLTLRYQEGTTKEVQSKTHGEAVFQIETLLFQQGYGAEPSNGV